MNLTSIDEWKTSALVIVTILFAFVMAYLALAGRAIPDGITSAEQVLIVTIGGVNIFKKRE